jgi:hypothetical protein
MTNLNWEAVAVISTVIIFALSLFYNSWSDRKNKLRDIKLNYLIETYRLLADSVSREGKDRDLYMPKAETAITDIQLLGTTSQIKIIQELAERLRDEKVNFDPVLNDLRSQLRKELGLPHVPGKISVVRFRKKVA